MAKWLIDYELRIEWLWFIKNNDKSNWVRGNGDTLVFVKPNNWHGNEKNSLRITDEMYFRTCVTDKMKLKMRIKHMSSKANQLADSKSEEI